MKTLKACTYAVKMEKVEKKLHLTAFRSIKFEAEKSFKSVNVNKSIIHRFHRLWPMEHYSFLFMMNFESRAVPCTIY